MNKAVSFDKESGFALVAALLMLFLLAVISIGMIYVANSETRTYTSDLGNSRAYYATEAAMEKMMVDIANLFLTVQTPTVSQLQAIGSTPPSLTGYSYPLYQVVVPTSGSNPAYTTRTISSGPNQGLIADILALTLNATGRTSSGTEVKMTRNIEVALIPIFQFGVFSDTDLSFFPGANMTFAGRVHTNGSLFLAADDPVTVTFLSKLSAAQEVIRAQQSNGTVTTTTSQNGPILIPNAPNGCSAGVANSTCRDLQETEGSRTGGVSSSVNSSWNNISTNLYNSWVVNGTTGARPLTLPFVATGMQAIEIIRRPPTGESATSLVGESRLYNMAQVRVLLSDDPAELPGGAGDAQNVRLANVGTYASGVPVPGALNTYFAEGVYYATNAGGCAKVDTDWIPPSTPAATGCTNWPLIDGYLRVEARQSGGSYTAVTQEWLQLGFARTTVTPNSETSTTNTVHPNAILIFQQLADRNGNGTLSDVAYTSGGTYYAAETTTITGTGGRTNWIPINLYDTREGELRAGGSNTSCAIGGIMNVVELDVGNLKKWLNGTIGTTGGSTDSSSQNGYILYFSDRRGMLANGSGVKVGEYGFEDILNPSDSAGVPDGVLQTAEDVNQNGSLDVYGKANLGDGFITAAQGGTTASDVPTTRVGTQIARKNRVTGARHGLKLINGSLGNIPTKSDGTGGFTVAAESGVYIQGNYNANNSGFGNPHAAASVIADAVITLSNAWLDRNSFANPTSASGRQATATWHRVAIAGGKNRAFAHPSWDTSTDVGTDGGVHNFMRYLENWGSGITHSYQGSLVSLYYSQYNLSAYIPGCGAYGPPSRSYSFDTDFLDPNKLPPGTPRFRDVVNMGYQQVFVP